MELANRIRRIVLVLLGFGFIVYLAVFRESTSTTTTIVTGEAASQLPDNSYWTWKIQKVESDKLVFTGEAINIPVGEIDSVVVNPIEILTQSGEKINAEAEALVTEEGGLVLTITGVKVSELDRMIFSTDCECIRTGLFGRGGYSSTWISSFRVEEDKIVPFDRFKL